jgi:oligopeptide/dipeptide ABC transporter ATP-binding protein
MNSLDPLQRIVDQAVEICQVHSSMSVAEAKDRLRELFEVVGLQESRITDYPHQLSGGMQQRAIIALSLLLEPALIIADEPTTALDVIMQDQIFKHLDEIVEGTETSVLLITHDISVVFESCDKIAIMHAGQVAETGTTRELFYTPRHPYTILLQEAFPDVRHPDRDLEVIDGNPPKVFGDVDFCAFVDRCPWATEECRSAEPRLESVDGAETGHAAACFRKDEVADLYERQGKRTPGNVDGEL